MKSEIKKLKKVFGVIKITEEETFTKKELQVIQVGLNSIAKGGFYTTNKKVECFNERIVQEIFDKTINNLIFLHEQNEKKEAKK